MTDISDLDRGRMDGLTAGLPSKSAKIRGLASAGYQRADIARYLGIRYQFVYNVLSAPQRREERAPQASDSEAGGSSQGSPSEPSPDWVWATVGRGGTLQIPKAMLDATGLKEGDLVKISKEGDLITVASRAAALRDLQDHVRRYVPEGVSLVDQLLAERRAEAAGEMPDRRDG